MVLKLSTCRLGRVAVQLLSLQWPHRRRLFSSLWGSHWPHDWCVRQGERWKPIGIWRKWCKIRRWWCENPGRSRKIVAWKLDLTLCARAFCFADEVHGRILIPKIQISELLGKTPRHHCEKHILIFKFPDAFMLARHWDVLCYAETFLLRVWSNSRPSALAKMVLGSDQTSTWIPSRKKTSKLIVPNQYCHVSTIQFSGDFSGSETERNRADRATAPMASKKVQPHDDSNQEMVSTHIISYL